MCVVKGKKHKLVNSDFFYSWRWTFNLISQTNRYSTLYLYHWISMHVPGGWQNNNWIEVELCFFLIVYLPLLLVAQCEVKQFEWNHHRERHLSPSTFDSGAFIAFPARHVAFFWDDDDQDLGSQIDLMQKSRTQKINLLFSMNSL